jgi:hypothetical protein
MHPIPTNLLAPPLVKPGQPYYGDGSCRVEEEAPPNLQLEIHAGTAKDTNLEANRAAGKEEDNQMHHFANRLMEEHLSILFEMRQRQSGPGALSMNPPPKDGYPIRGALGCSSECQIPNLQPRVHPILQHTWSTRPSHRLTFPGFVLFLFNIVA